MKQSIAAKLAQLSRRLEEINRTLSSENVINDMDNYRKLTRESAEIEPVVALYREYEKSEGDFKAAEEMAADPAMREFAESEKTEIRARLEQLETDLQKQL
jgi:peptide chain release factor 1